MKEYDLRRFWIGREGLPYRYQYSSWRRDNKGIQKWVSVDWSRNNRVTSYKVRCTNFVHMYIGFSEDRRI
jgi:hypothetical protein